MLISLSLGNTELEMLLGYQSRDADNSWKYCSRIQGKAGSRGCKFGSNWCVCGLSHRTTLNHQGRVLVTVIGQESKPDHDRYERWWSEPIRPIELKKNNR